MIPDALPDEKGDEKEEEKADEKGSCRGAVPPGRLRLLAVLGAVSLLAGCDAGPVAPPAPDVTSSPGAPPSPQLVAERLAAAAVTGAPVRLAGSPRIPRKPVDAPPFSRRQGNEVGISSLGLISPDEFQPPFINGRGIAAGDFDRDGFDDVLVATEHGVELYRNHGGAIFVRQPIDVPALDELNVFVVVLVDVNDDGWLDLFVTSYMQGNHVVLSQEGRFTADGWWEVAEPPSMLTTAIAFGDVDEDGDLDAYAGNWYYGAHHQIPPEDSMNQLLVYDGARYEPRAMTGEILGETLAVLLSDFDMDGHLDLVVGNDFAPPDLYYLGDGRGEFRMIHRTEELIPKSTESTMSIDTADFDNDLDFDIYLSQIAEGVPQIFAASARYAMRAKTAYCDELNNPDEKARCREGVRHHDLFAIGAGHRAEHIARCDEIKEEGVRRECQNEMRLLTAILEKRPEVCEEIYDDAPMVKRRCRAVFKPAVEGTPEQYTEAIPQIRGQNVLLRRDTPTRFTNVAEAIGAEIGGWSWSALFFDADNDEWQDLYVVNGTWLARKKSSQKFFLRNIRGHHFEDQTEAFGLQSFMVQSAYVVIDFEGDGDLDLLVNGIHGPFWYYQNNDAKNNSVSFALRDEIGNRYCIGCKIRIDYGAKGQRAQIREIKLGGGYHSFNPATAHFGLAEHSVISAIEVHWSTGGKTRIEGPLPANTLYEITRLASAEGSQQADAGRP